MSSFYSHGNLFLERTVLFFSSSFLDYYFPTFFCSVASAIILIIGEQNKLSTFADQVNPVYTFSPLNIHSNERNNFFSASKKKIQL